MPVKTFRATYVGTGWYGKSFTVPDEWKGKRIWLNFGGISPSAQLWLNGIALGEHRYPLVPFAYDITALLHEGENNITVRVHGIGCWSSGIFGGMWSGIYRDVELPPPPIRI